MAKACLGGRGGGRHADRFGELGVEVDELGVTAPHLPRANMSLYLYAKYDVSFGFGTLFVAPHVHGLDGGHGHRYKRVQHETAQHEELIKLS
jgi:hypothetical protein